MADDSESESTLTVVLAFAANLLIAIAKSVAAVITGSASMVAEAAHSWADAGNEVLLLVANRRAQAEPDEDHPLGFGREAYVWSMFAALGLFALGAGVSVTHGVQELFHSEDSSEFMIAYIVLGVAFVLEGISFQQAYRQLRNEAKDYERNVLQHALNTSDPTTRAVFAEDLAALVGLIIAFTGVLLHQITGSPIPDAIGSIAVGVLLGIVAIVLVDRNRRFLIGEQASPQLRSAGITTLLELPDVERVTFIRMEFLGPRRVYLIASVDLVGDFRESEISETLRRIESQIEENVHVVRAILSLSTRDEVSITP